MTTETPLACSLGAGDYRARIGWLEQLNRGSLRRLEREDLTLRLTYDPTAREAVEALVAQERECCAFLDFQVAANPDGLVLTIRAPERARELSVAIFAEFTSGAGPAAAPACGYC